ncbi:MAG: FeoB-associated Cys-rich membrane protein [Peptoniphilus sp.]|nr:FeoB-associated Cys-rich membrane protein [Peptoniphilus sp.]
MNLPTVSVLIVLMGVVVFAIKHSLKTKGCDGGCKSCKYSASCHSDK